MQIVFPAINLVLLAAILAGVAALAALLAVLVLWRQGARRAHELAQLRMLAQQSLAGTRAEAEATRVEFRASTLAMAERLVGLGGTLNTGVEQVRTVLSRGQGDVRLALAEGLGQMREANEQKLAEIQKSVNEHLHEAVEKQMKTSFERVIDQFTAVQKAMADVRAVTEQIGDIKRLFGNVKTRGGWGETQVKAMLDDVLPPGAYLTNHRIRPDNDDRVEFAVRMPMRGETRPLLPIDAKFPTEDYERLLAASEAGDAQAEREATRGLDRRIRDEAKKIHAKYVYPPITVEFAVLYLPTDALYAEVARIPGLIDDLGRDCRVLVMGPTLFPALLRTIHLGFVTLALEDKADQIRTLLGATRTEMLKMDEVLDRLLKQAGTFTATIETARVRTRAVGRRLKDVGLLDYAAETED